MNISTNKNNFPITVFIISIPHIQTSFKLKKDTAHRFDLSLRGEAAKGRGWCLKPHGGLFIYLAKLSPQWEALKMAYEMETNTIKHHKIIQNITQ